MPQKSSATDPPKFSRIDDLLGDLMASIDEYRSKPTRPSAGPRRPQSARGPPRVLHTHHPRHVGRLLKQADAAHRSTAEDSLRNTPTNRGSQTARSLTPSPLLHLFRQHNERTPFDFWSAESVFTALDAAPSVRLLSGKWLVQQFLKQREDVRAAASEMDDEELGDGSSDNDDDDETPRRRRALRGSPRWKRGAALPRQACVSVDDLRSFYRTSSATPKESINQPKRLPIVAVAQDLSAEEMDDDFSHLIRTVGGALENRLHLYRHPYGEDDPRCGFPDVGVFVDVLSLQKESSGTFAGEVGDAVAALFAHRLTTVYLATEEEYEYHAKSSYFRALARLCKRVHKDQTVDPWPVLVELIPPYAHPPKLSDGPPPESLRRPSPPLQPPGAFEEGGPLEASIAFDSLDEMEQIGAKYREVCNDLFFYARRLDWSLPRGTPPSGSWDDGMMRILGELLPLCRNLHRLNLSGHSAITFLPESLGTLQPPPPLPFVRGRPKSNAGALVASLEALDLNDCPRLKRLPDSICRLGNLRTINLEWCVALQALPEAIGDLQELRSLSMKGCELIKSLPESLGDLKPPWGTLETLNLDFCSSLERLPTAAGALVALHHLSLYGCRSLQKLPTGLRGLLSLHVFDLEGCTALIGRLPVGELKLLEDRGCRVRRPNPPPPPAAREQPTYKLGAMRAFTRRLYGFDVVPDNVDEGESHDADQNARGDAAMHGKGYVTAGALVFEAGDWYEGKYKDGLQEGPGTYFFADGRKYEGQWHLGSMEGMGTFNYGRGNEYEGEFLNGRPHGHGQRLYADGDRYDGQWVDGKKEGVGKLRYANGDSFEGEFQGDLRQGPGVYRYHDGEHFEGEWHQDRLKPSRVKRSAASERNARIQLSQALVQENEEMRAVIRDARGGVPLKFRRPKQRLTDEALRKENATLKEFIHGVAHEEFVATITVHRAETRATILNVEAAGLGS